MSPRCHVSRQIAGLTGLLAAADVPLLVRLSLAHRQDDFVPGVRLQTVRVTSTPACRGRQRPCSIAVQHNAAGDCLRVSLAIAPQCRVLAGQTRRQRVPPGSAIDTHNPNPNPAPNPNPNPFSHPCDAASRPPSHLVMTPEPTCLPVTGKYLAVRGAVVPGKRAARQRHHGADPGQGSQPPLLRP